MCVCWSVAEAGTHDTIASGVGQITSVSSAVVTARWYYHILAEVPPSIAKKRELMRRFARAGRSVYPL